MRSFAIRHRGFHVMFYSLLSIQESSVFVARLKSPRFLFLVSEQWHQHVTFINLRSSLSHWILWWKIPPQAKVEHAVTKQVWGHWKLSFTNKWEWQECTQPVTAMLQCDGGCATGISCWLNGRITLGYGWLFGWVIWWSNLCCALWAGAAVRISCHHDCMLQSFKMAIWKGKKKR